MGSSAEEFVDKLLTKEALEQPSDNVKPEELDIQLPPNFDEKKFNQGRRFYWDNCFMFSASMMLGLVAVFAVPSILRVLIGSRRSSSSYTAYKRYLSTLLHTVSWFEHDLKPGSKSWKSLYTVRSRHLRAGLASRLKGGDTVSQRDIALTQFGFIGFSVLKPDGFGITSMKEGDWDAYNYFWRVIGYMIGLEDRYNICRDTIDETREVCQLLLDRVYTPCLENVPEHFEHMARAMLDGMVSINPTATTDGMLFATRYLADVPGYVYTENDRIAFEKKLKKFSKERPDGGVDTALLISKPAIEGTPDRPPRILYLKDYASVATCPTYKTLTFNAKFKVAFGHVAAALYCTAIGRWYFNLNFHWSLILMKYFPYMAFFKFGIQQSYVNIFAEDPTDDTKPKSNDEYYKEDEEKYKARNVPWYWSILMMFKFW